MSIGTLLFVLIGILYIVFAFRPPPEAIEHHFRIPALFVFFPAEQRVKYGRIALGALLILLGLGTTLPSVGGGVAGTIAGLVIVGLQLAARWKLAGEVAEAEDAERRAQWQSFEALKQDARFHHLLRYLGTHHRLTFDAPADRTTYRVLYAELFDAGWQRLLAHQGAAARYLVAYLERADSPKRIHASVDLQTGACGERVAGLLGFGGAVPLAPVTP